METEDILSSLQDPATGRCPDKFTSLLHIYFIILPSTPRSPNWSLPSSVFDCSERRFKFSKFSKYIGLFLPHNEAIRVLSPVDHEPV